MLMEYHNITMFAGTMEITIRRESGDLLELAKTKPIPSGYLLHSHGFSMALIEIDGSPFLKTHGDDFPWLTVNVIIRGYVHVSGQITIIH